MKILVTFKRWDGFKDEKFEHYGGSLKNSTFKGGYSQKTNIQGRIAKKRGGLGQFVDLSWGLARKSRLGIFEGRGLIPQ